MISIVSLGPDNARNQESQTILRQSSLEAWRMRPKNWPRWHANLDGIGQQRVGTLGARIRQLVFLRHLRQQNKQEKHAETRANAANGVGGKDDSQLIGALATITRRMLFKCQFPQLKRGCDMPRKLRPQCLTSSGLSNNTD